MDKSYCQSLDTPVTEDGKSTIEDTLVYRDSPFTDVFTKEAIEKSLRVLNPNEKKVISMYYGLNGEVESPIKEIAKEIGLGDERIRQLRKNGIKKLRQKCGKNLKTLL